MTMKKLFEKMKTYSFWVSFSGALIIFLNCLGNAFDFKIENEIVENCIMAFAGLLVVLGIVTKDDKKSNDKSESGNAEENEQQGTKENVENSSEEKTGDDSIKGNDSKEEKDVNLSE